MAQLAIQGHATRGSEVIQLLEMLGGVDTYKITTAKADLAYTIRSHDNVIMSVLPTNTFIILSLEEFLEKFPYKVGDKVKCWINGYLSIDNIKDIQWDSIVSEVKYKIGDYWYNTINLQPYKEETKPEIDYEMVQNELMGLEIEKSCMLHDYDEYEKAVNEHGYYSEEAITRRMFMFLRNKGIAQNVLENFGFNLPEGYIFKDENGNEILTSKIILEKKKRPYPKTYKECCDILLIPPYYNLRYLTYEPGYNKYATSNILLSLENKLNMLGKLLICRDAYWKIAGEQMGLGQPWKPDFDNLSTNLEYIKIVKGCFTYSSRVFAFPTKEMRDAFKEYFNMDLETCKELL